MGRQNTPSICSCPNPSVQILEPIVALEAKSLPRNQPETRSCSTLFPFSATKYFTLGFTLDPHLAAADFWIVFSLRKLIQSFSSLKILQEKLFSYFYLENWSAAMIPSHFSWYISSVPVTLAVTCSLTNEMRWAVKLPVLKLKSSHTLTLVIKVNVPTLSDYMTLGIMTTGNICQNIEPSL